MPGAWPGAVVWTLEAEQPLLGQAWDLAGPRGRRAGRAAWWPVRHSVAPLPWGGRGLSSAQPPLSCVGTSTGQPGARALNNVCVFSPGGSLKRRKNFHFDFALRYRCLGVCSPSVPGWSLGLFSSVGRWGCVWKGGCPDSLFCLPDSHGARGAGRTLPPPRPAATRGHPGPPSQSRDLS